MELEDRLPRQVINSSTATLSVSSRYRKKKFAMLLEESRTGKVSGAIWKAIDYYLQDRV